MFSQGWGWRCLNILAHRRPGRGSKEKVSVSLCQGPCDIHVLSWQSPEPVDVLTLQPEQEFVIPVDLGLVITGLSWTWYFFTYNPQWICGVGGKQENCRGVVPGGKS